MAEAIDLSLFRDDDDWSVPGPHNSWAVMFKRTPNRWNGERILPRPSDMLKSKMRDKPCRSHSAKHDWLLS